MREQKVWLFIVNKSKKTAFYFTAGIKLHLGTADLLVNINSGNSERRGQLQCDWQLDWSVHRQLSLGDVDNSLWSWHLGAFPLLEIEVTLNFDWCLWSAAMRIPGRWDLNEGIWAIWTQMSRDTWSASKFIYCTVPMLSCTASSCFSSFNYLTRETCKDTGLNIAHAVFMWSHILVQTDTILTFIIHLNISQRGSHKPEVWYHVEQV